jgi:Sulfotransferase family
VSGDPIILVGSHRSGTTWLGEVLSRHPRLAYWVEPRHVWTWGNSYTPDDVLTENDATDKVKAHIRKTFAEFVEREGKDRLAEKTPSNCLRLRFIREVFPEARILMVIRDGRSVLRSTDEIMARGVPLKRVITRARETPLTEWPAYAGQAVGTVYRRVTGKKLNFWGPRPPGWRDWLNEDPPDVIMAKQWAGIIGTAVDDADALDAQGCGVYRFRYEDLLNRPREIMTEACTFAELENPEPVIDFAEQTADPARASKWRTMLDKETLELVRPHMQPMLERLGYDW